MTRLQYLDYDGNIAALCESKSEPERTGIFRDHNCWRCKDGQEPCAQGHPNRCEFPHARDD